MTNMHDWKSTDLSFGGKALRAFVKMSALIYSCYTSLSCLGIAWIKINVEYSLSF
jgi:hypothetical protein